MEIPLTEAQKTQIAAMILRTTQDWARAMSPPQDHDAATAAILRRAVELLTPSLSDDLRAGQL